VELARVGGEAKQDLTRIGSWRHRLLASDSSRESPVRHLDRDEPVQGSAGQFAQMIITAPGRLVEQRRHDVAGRLGIGGSPPADPAPVARETAVL